MAFNINDMKAHLKLGGARPSLFQVQITNPVNALGDIQTPFMCKAATIPASTLGTIEVPYFGRKIKLAGDRTFEEWTTTLINDEDFLVRNSIEEWSNAINNHESNLRDFGSASPLQYKSEAEVTQFSKTGTILRVYKFEGIWPSVVSTIDLAWETVDTIEEFTVSWQYDTWSVSGGITGDAGTS